MGVVEQPVSPTQCLVGLGRCCLHVHISWPQFPNVGSGGHFQAVNSDSSLALEVAWDAFVSLILQDSHVTCLGLYKVVESRFYFILFFLLCNCLAGLLREGTGLKCR